MPGGALSCMGVSVLVGVVNSFTVSPRMFVMVMVAFSFIEEVILMVNEPWLGLGKVEMVDVGLLMLFMLLG